MAFAQYLVVTLPAWLLGIGAVILAILFSIISLLIVKKYFPSLQDVSSNDLADYIFGKVGTLYAVLLGFSVIITWQSYDLASKTVSREANHIASVYRESFGLSPEFQKEVHPLLKDYVHSIINDEWQTMQVGKRSEKTQEIQEKIWHVFTSYQPKGESEIIFFKSSLESLKNMVQERRERILDSSSGNPTSLWIVLLIGGMITLSCALFFGSSEFHAQILMTALFSCLVGLALFTVLAFDYPFSGDAGITPDSFATILQTMLKAGPG